MIVGEAYTFGTQIGDPSTIDGVFPLTNPINLDVVNVIDDVNLIPTHHVHEQTSQSTVWAIQHDLGYDPAGVVITDEVGNLHWPMVTYPTPGSVIQLSFTNPVRGTCRLS